jgi:hypothetical protein
MTNPFFFRPKTNYPSELDYGVVNDEVEWEDNWISNAMAWVSQKLMPTWCATPSHWTSKFSNYFWTSCGCCLLFRGIVIGATLALAFMGIINSIF